MSKFSLCSLIASGTTPLWRLRRIAKRSSFPLEGCLFQAISSLPYNRGFFSLLLKKNTREDLASCLFLAISRFPRETKFLTELALLAEGFLDDCFLHAIISLEYSEKLFRLLFEKTNFYAGCLFEAIDYFPKETEFLLKLIKVTPDFNWCLLKATKGVASGVSKKVVMAIFERCLKLRSDYNKNLFTGSLYWAICNLSGDKEYINRLLEETDDFEWCLWAAIYVSPEDDCLLERLVAVTENFNWALQRVLALVPHKVELARKLIPKTTYFADCVALAICNANELVEEIFVASGEVKVPLPRGALLERWGRYCT